MPSPLQPIVDAIEARAGADAFLGLPVPQTFRAVTLHRDEEKMFEGVASAEKDPRKSLHVDEVPLPALGPGEALVAVMASAINFNTVWSAIFEPVSTFSFCRAMASEATSGSGTICRITSSAATRRGWCCASVPGSPGGSPATAWWSTATTWISRSPRATTTP